ncbi:1,3,6,8-tetrahydroxynaphthalene synthase (plasmid) [Kitasatospora sp. CMC57]|uniref:1,3,6,8-tetrahydroxynaphthalene synthase n=1 Tax=Kitasatospora sp. CMC57 TaxID=3231513 RepID=A0AB33K7Y4_9ACTN
MAGPTPVYVSRPFSHLAEHLVTRDQILEDMTRRHPDHPRLAVVKRVVGKMPAMRRMSQPWDTVLAERTAEQRNTIAFADVLRMGTGAARGALARSGFSPAAVDCVVTSHSTGDAVPGLDAHLVKALGLRPDVARRPMTQLGCGGGAHGLLFATDYIRAHPGTVVLLVVAESLSSIYHHGDTSIEGMIYKALWGDCGIAVLLSDRPLGPGLRIEETWEYLIPGTVDRYRKRVDEEGVHFDSDKSATDSVAEMSPALLGWLAGRPDGRAGRWPLEFVVSHTGGPAVLDDLAKHLGLAPGSDGDLVHSWESLDQDGNLGGASVLRVLERTYATPPPAGATGLAIGFGPGFSVSAAKVTWHAS